MISSTPTRLQKNNEVTTSQTVSLSTAAHDKEFQQAQTFATVEFIRATTPLLLAMVGLSIGLFTLVAKPENADVKTAGFGLASSAIAGAAGLAQSHSRQT